MRVSAGLAALVLAIAAPVLAQEYVEFTSSQDRFGVTFPVQPKVEETMWKSQFGSMLPARIYYRGFGQQPFQGDRRRLQQHRGDCDRARQVVPTGRRNLQGRRQFNRSRYWKADLAGATTYAQWQFMQRDAKITYLGWNNIDLVEGHDDLHDEQCRQVAHVGGHLHAREQAVHP